MNILIDNVMTYNKGSELMIYAVLQELEKIHPDANIFFHAFCIPEGAAYFKTTMNCRLRKVPLAIRLFRKIKGDAILRRLFRIPFSYATDKYPIKGLNVVLDAGGFQFSDQCCGPAMNVRIKMLRNYYKVLKNQGTKIVFLSQAFGPFETKSGKEYVKLLKEYADCIVAREEISYTHLINTDIDEKKVLLFPDFTALVEGIFPVGFEYLKSGIAIIPNLRTIKKGLVSKENYTDILLNIIDICKKTGKVVFFLNHGGKEDLKICEDVNERLDEKLSIVKNLTALEVKGIISKCFFVFSSRFHGLVSALSTGVPCLATSWSHKYEMLFNDYGMQECILDPNNSGTFIQRLEQLLDIDYNNLIRDKLRVNAENIKVKNKEMWRHIWNEIDN